MFNSRVLILCWTLGACSHSAHVSQKTEPAGVRYVERVQRARVEGHTDRLSALMSDHFRFTAWARDATSIGDMAAAREALLNLANYAYDDVVPGAWLPRVRALQEDARGVAGAASLETLANGVAGLARECGDCHAATGGGPAVSRPAPDSQHGARDSFPDRMFRHRQAIEQLWTGLITPSNAVWEQGAFELSRVSAELDVQGELPAEFADAFQRLTSLGARARLARTAPEREQSYGLVLGACADCHRRPWPATFR